MGSTFEDLLKSFIVARDTRHESRNMDVDYRLTVMESTVQAMLEKLRDIHDKK